MPQSVIGILALVLAILYTIHQQHAIMTEYEDMIRDEYEIMASGVALEVMEDVSRHPFDEATSGPYFVMTEEFKISKLAKHPFVYAYTYDEAMYLEHFNGTKTERSFQAGTSSISFDAEVEVHYVDESGEETKKRTDKKQVIVRVFHERYPLKLVELRRTISPVITSDDT